MPWNGSGSFTRTNGDNTGATLWEQDAADGVDIVTDRHDTHDQDLASGINDCLTKDGQNAATADLNLGGFRYTNSGEPEEPNDLVRAASLLVGWMPVTEAWTYASASTINIPSGGASRYQKGDKIKCTNSGTKYFNVVGVADTLLTVTGGSDYVVDNAGISNVQLSRANRPFGFPDWFAYTTVLSASAGAVSLQDYIRRSFRIDGSMCQVYLASNFTLSGASATFVTFTLPVNSAVTEPGYGSALVNLGSGAVGGYSIITPVGNVNIYHHNNSQFLTGAARFAGTQCFYPI